MENSNNNIPCIALVGNAPQDKCEVLNSILDEECITEVCDIVLYGADEQPEEEALTDAIEDYRDGKIDGIACLPMKESLTKAFENAMGDEAGKAVAISIHTTGRLASVMGDMSIADAAVSLTKEAVIEKATALSKILKRDLSILNPRIAVLSLNKEISTEESSEEINIIAPAVSELVNSGIQAFGPIASDKFFEDDGFMAYDAILAMYDGQVREDFLKASNEHAITMLSGLVTPTAGDNDIPVTQGEAEDIFRACCLAIDIAHNRRVYDKPFAHPLEKCFHEHREDGDKARFAVKKKGFNPAEHRRENVTFITLPPKDSVKE